MKGEDDLVVVARFGPPWEGRTKAEVAKLMLEDAGIPCVIPDMQVPTLIPHTLQAPDGVRVLVRRKDAEAALAVLQSLESEESSREDEEEEDTQEEEPYKRDTRRIPMPFRLAVGIIVFGLAISHFGWNEQTAPGLLILASIITAIVFLEPRRKE